MNSALYGARVGMYRRWGKRAFDLAISCASLVILAPVLALCALLIRLTSGRGVFFRQVRLGEGGHPFRVIKFRTMHEGSDRVGPAVVIAGDQRVTFIGRMLRRIKLDELPQLLNVLLGDMSLVGPRPRVPGLVNQDNPEEQALLSLRPGMTSYASVFHRMEEFYCRQHSVPQEAYLDLQKQKGQLDSEYLRNLSFAFDLKLLFLTIFLIFLPGKGESRTVSIRGVQIRPYSRASQIVLDLAVFGTAVWLAYWLRFEAGMSEFHRYQMGAFVVLVPTMRLAANQACGVYDMIWRYVGLADASIYALSLAVISAILLILRLLLPADVPSAHVFQMPLGVIAMEYLLVLGGGLSLRALRRALYVLNHRYQPLPAARRRRVLILGAGLSGVGIALEIARYPHLQVVGFVDDDAGKQGCRIAGHRVIGSTEDLPGLIRENQVTDLIVCARSMASEHMSDVREICESLGVSVHLIPTVAQLLGSAQVEPAQPAGLV